MAKTRTYQQMADELSAYIEWFENGDVNLDDAITKYAQATELIKAMETYLKTANNKVKKIALKFDQA